jgi:hypothetical protein
MLELLLDIDKTIPENIEINIQYQCGFSITY